jgi:exodeoxyribonuclease VII large subunit
MVRIDSLARRTIACWQRCQEGRRTELRAAARALPTAEEFLALPRQRLDHVAARLPRALTANAQIHHREFSRVAVRLSPRMLRTRVERCRELTAALAERASRADAVARTRRRERLGTATARLAAGLRANADAHRNRIGHARERITALIERADRAVLLLLDQRNAAVERCGQLLAALSHRGVLARGFALVRDLDGHPLRNAAAISPAQRLDIEFSDGRVQAVAEGSSLEPAAKPAPRARPRPRRRGGHDPGQGNLFGA